MQIIITGRHFEVTEVIHRRIVDKLEALFQCCPTLKVSTVRVTMELEKKHRAKVDIRAALKKQQLFAGGAALELYSALDDAMDKLHTRLGRYVDKYKRPEATPPARDLCFARPLEA